MRKGEIGGKLLPQQKLYKIGLTQTPFGKKSEASDSASETVKRAVAEARGPRRTDACCVSPIKYTTKNFALHDFFELKRKS